MISPRLALHDLDPVAWRHAQRLLVPPARSGHRTRAPSPLLLFVEGGRCVKALRPGGPGGATLRVPDVAWQGAWSLGKLRRAAGAPWALAIEDDALARIARALETEVSPTDDPVAQGLCAWRVLRGEMGKGIHLDPDPLQSVPVPPFAALQKTFDALLPDGRSAALFVFDKANGRDEVWTSIIVEKQAGDLVRVTTHAALGVARPEFRGGAHKELLDAIATRIARPHLAAFMTLDAWRDVASPTPGALARQVALREAVLDPSPSWLVAATGMGAVAGVAQEASRLFGRFVPQVVKDTARAVNPFAALGFDPIQIFVELQKVFGGGSR